MIKPIYAPNSVNKGPNPESLVTLVFKDLFAARNIILRLQMPTKKINTFRNCRVNPTF